jgi:hypothetical protein
MLFWWGLMKHLRSKAVARAARFALALGTVMAAAACAAVLGIDDRDLIGSTTGSEAGDAPNGDGPAIDGRVDDGGLDSSLLVDGDAARSCNPTACGAVNGGACSPDGTCVVTCSMATCPASSTLACPAGHDCVVKCGTKACDKLRCTGGNSCTIDCSVDMSCHNGVACQSGRCDFICTGATDSCGGGGGSLPVECEASICQVNCGGPGSCTGGVNAEATSYCGISCTGATSCSTDGDKLNCNHSPDASIVCGTAMNTCQSSKPYCFGGNCSIACLAAGSCGKNYCCEAGVCAQTGTPRVNACP